MPQQPDRTPLAIDLARVQVTNIGRTAISVSDITLDFGAVGTQRWRRLGRDRHTVRGYPVSLPGATTEDTTRLEPGATVITYFDFWQVIGAARHDTADDRRISVRGSVIPAGRRAVRSARRKRWTILPDQTELRPDATVDAAVRAYRALWRALRNSEPGKLGMAWALICTNIDPQVTAAEIAEALEPGLGIGQTLLAAQVVAAIRGVDLFEVLGAPDESPGSQPYPADPPPS